MKNRQYSSTPVSCCDLGRNRYVLVYLDTWYRYTWYRYNAYTVPVVRGIIPVPDKYFVHGHSLAVVAQLHGRNVLVGIIAVLRNTRLVPRFWLLIVRRAKKMLRVYFEVQYTNICFLRQPRFCVHCTWTKILLKILLLIAEALSTHLVKVVFVRIFTHLSRTKCFRRRNTLGQVVVGAKVRATRLPAPGNRRSVLLRTW